MHEFDRIARYFAPLSAAEAGAFTLTDDAAMLAPSAGASFVFTKDCMVEGTHFIGNESPALIAQKLLRSNLSDLCAMGATPRAYMLGLMLPQSTTQAWFESFAQGLAADGAHFNVTLIGGDTTSGTTRICLSLTAIGEIIGHPLTRAGARAGDDVYVSGSLGESALGLALLRGDIACENATHRATLIDRYHLPQPRITLGESLHGLASACMDISDGLLQDAAHIARASNCAITMYADALPISDAARSTQPQLSNFIEIIATGGDDYELLFTAPKTARDSIAALSQSLTLPLTRIGEITSGAVEVTLIDEAGKPHYFASHGFRHF